MRTSLRFESSVFNERRPAATMIKRAVQSQNRRRSPLRGLTPFSMIGVQRTGSFDEACCILGYLIHLVKHVHDLSCAFKYIFRSWCRLTLPPVRIAVA